MVKKITKIEPVRMRPNAKKQRKKRVCAYCRVSTDSHDQKNSYFTQMEYYTKLINDNPVWEFSGIYADEAKSGTELTKRDDFFRMMEDCRAGAIDMVITKSVTRFARNTIDSIEAIRELKLLGISVYFEKENIDTLSEKSEIMLSVLSSLAQSESESISTNVRWSVQRRFQSGTFIVSVPAYGYRNGEDGELVVYEEEARVVRNIYQDYLNGKGAYTIASELNEKQIPCARSAEQWLESVVKGILQNEVYIGNLLLQKTYTTEAIPFIRKMNKGELPQYLIEQNHEAIIAAEQAEAVKRIFAYRHGQSDMTDKMKYQQRYTFSSNIACGSCGSIFRRQKLYIGKSYETIQWSCVKHIKGKTKCPLKGVRESAIQSAFVIMWNKLATNYEKILVPLLESLKGFPVGKEQAALISNCENKIFDLTQQSKILSASAAKGYLDSAVFYERFSALNEMLIAEKDKLNVLNRNNNFIKEIRKTEYLISLVQSHPGILEIFDDEIFLQAVEKIIISEDQRITFRLVNQLDLSECWGKESRGDHAKPYNYRVPNE